MKVTVIGGGNVGTQFAVHCAAVGYETTIYTSKPKMFADEVSIVDEKYKEKLKGRVLAVDGMESACKEANLIFVTMPASMLEDLAKEMLPHLQAGTMVGLIPGTGGGECAFQPAIEKGVIVFGLQRVPSVARLVEYGKCVRATGYRSNLHLAAIPHQHTQDCRDLISGIFNISCHVLPNYLNVTLTPSNPILHTTRLCSLFHGYQKGMLYSRIPLFYEEWSDDSSKLLWACDREVQNICNALKNFNLGNVKSLKEHYESNTPEQLTLKLRSISSLKGIETPCVKVAGGYVPDFNSRYFTADFPYGLEIIVQIAQFAGVSAPNCCDVLKWYYDLAGKTEAYSYRNYDINEYEAFEKFYRQ